MYTNGDKFVVYGSYGIMDIRYCYHMWDFSKRGMLPH